MSFNSCVLLLLTSSFLGKAAQNNFAPVKMAAEVLPTKRCEMAMAPDISGSLATVAELVKNTDIVPSFPKSCMELKESSPVSPSGYYTISNGNEGSIVVYCNMDELYSCPSLEQTLNGFSNNLAGISSKIVDVSNNVASSNACNKLATSCQEVWNKCHECTSGYYKLQGADLTIKTVYCDFRDKCDTSGPWTRVAYLNMSDNSSVCPPGTQKFVSGSDIACGTQEPGSLSGTCVSITASVTSHYSQICGQVAGYQKGSTDGFNTNGIDSIYLDGVSITRGSPRQHVWSYVIALQENVYTNLRAIQG